MKQIAEQLELNEKGMLYLPASALPLEYSAIPALLKDSYSHLEPVKPAFWKWQVGESVNLSSLLVAHKPSKAIVEWPGLSFLSQIAEFPVLFQWQKKYADVITQTEQPLFPDCPTALFYNPRDTICTIHWNSEREKPPFNVDGATIEELISENNVSYVARDIGYLLFFDNTLKIVHPTITNRDQTRLDIWLCPLSDSFRPAMEQFLFQYLQQRRKNWPQAPYQIQDASELLSHLLGSTARLVTLCQGTSAEQGRSARLQILKKQEALDGVTVDYHQMKQYLTVAKGEEVARKYQMIPSREGMDIMGQKINVSPVTDLNVKLTGPIVENEKEEDQIISYIADAPGMLLFSDHSLEIREVFVIEKNVDYHTGNIDFDKVVEIRGDVKAGFSVKSKSDVIIQGCVEDGARIESGGDTLVLGGVLGEHTFIEAKKDIQVGYLQDARMIAGGDIRVEKNLLRGSLYCSGHLTVDGKGIKAEKHGALVGGHYSALKGMTLHSVGSSAVSTHLSTGHNLILKAYIEGGQKEQAFLERKQLSLMKMLPLDLTTAQGKAKIALLNDKQKEDLKKNLLLMKNISQKREELKEKIFQWLAEEFNDDPLSMPVIDVEQQLFGDLEIEIGRKSRLFSLADQKGQSFHLVEMQILMDPMEKKS